MRARGRAEPIRLLLKIGRPGELNEVRFYQGLSRRLPIDTARVLDARELADRSGWILMEELQGAKSFLSLTPCDVRSVVRDMAKLHAGCWGEPRLLDEFPWLSRPDATTIGEQVKTMRSSAAMIEAAGLPDVLPQLVSRPRLRWIARVLDGAEAIVGPLLAPGTTFVHGDYWLHNVQLLPDGRRVLVDWQSCRVFSGVWELVYFLDLRQVVGPRSFRTRDPEGEERIVGWYVDSLREAGVEIPRDAFREALACASIWHPLTHWLTRYGRMAERALAAPGWRVARSVPAAGRLVATALASRGAIRFMAATWARFEQDARRRIS